MKLTRPAASSDTARAVVSGMAVVALILLAGSWLKSLAAMLHSEAGRYDFSSYYAAALALRHDMHADIYSSVVLNSAGVAGGVMVRPPLPYAYPPLFAILLAPFTMASFRVLSRLWLVGNTLMWLALFALIARELWLQLGEPLMDRLHGSAIEADTRGGGHLPCHDLSDSWRAQVAAGIRALASNPATLLIAALAALVVLPYTPAAQTVLTGQIDLLVALLLAVVPELSRRGHERWVGIAIACAAMLKLTPLILVVYLVLRRRWTAARSALATLGLLTLGSVVLVGPGTVAAGVAQAWRVGGGDTTLAQNEALLASLPGAHTGILAALVWVLRLVLALGMGYLLWRGHASVVRGAGDVVGYAMALCGLLLLSPTDWVHHFVWVLPALAVAIGLALRHWLEARANDWHALTWVALVALAAMALGWQLPFGWDTQAAPARESLLGVSLHPPLMQLRALGTLAVLAVLLALGTRAAWVRNPRRAGEMPASSVAR